MIGPFRGDYYALSNFWIEPDGTHTEGEFQAAKTLDPRQREFVLTLSPKASKQAASAGGLLLSSGEIFKITFRSDWESPCGDFETLKEAYMYQLLWRKFSDHPKAQAVLLGTGEEEIVELNTWGDREWGVCGGVGKNKLGKTHMRIRAEMRAGLTAAIPAPAQILPVPLMAA